MPILRTLRRRSRKSWINFTTGDPFSRRHYVRTVHKGLGLLLLLHGKDMRKMASSFRLQKPCSCEIWKISQYFTHAGYPRITVGMENITWKVILIKPGSDSCYVGYIHSLAAYVCGCSLWSSSYIGDLLRLALLLKQSYFIQDYPQNLADACVHEHEYNTKADIYLLCSVCHFAWRVFDLFQFS